MLTLSTSDAITLVRKNLDEADPNGSIMYDNENGSSANYGDNNSMDDIIKKCLPEAINIVQLAAPVTMLEGVEVSSFTDTSLAAKTLGKVLSFTPSGVSDYLRLVAFKAADSDIVITDAIPEASAEGRKQHNPYVMGTYDRPRLVILQGDHTTGPSFRYYSMKPTFSADNIATAISLFLYVKQNIYAAATTSYSFSRLLRQNVIDQLTGMVLQIYNDQRAQFFLQRANIFQ